jgi:hypothetical protein
MRVRVRVRGDSKNCHNESLRHIYFNKTSLKRNKLACFSLNDSVNERKKILRDFITQGKIFLWHVRV